MRNRNYKNQNNNVVEKEAITNNNKVQIVDDTVSNIEEPIVENVISEKDDVADVVIKAKVVNGNLNFRSSKNNIDDRNIITTIPDNEIVTVIEKPSAKKPGWSKVKYDDKVGFVMDQFLKYI